MVDKTLVIEAIKLYKDGKIKESLEKLRGILRDADAVNALLWIAKVSENERESISAAEIAMALEPDNEVARRAILSLRKKFNKQPSEIDITQFTGMTLSEARSVIWPFKGTKKPIGALLESGEITIRDIAWASESANDSHIKNAAKTILLSGLFPEKIAEPLKPAKVVLGRGYTGFQRRRTLSVASFTFGGASGIFLIFLFIWVWGKSQAILAKNFSQYKTLIDMVFVFLVFAVAPLLLLWLSDNFLNQSEHYRIGEGAENQAVDSFRSLLYKPWTIIHNFEFPNRQWGDIDLILIGTGGVWVIEVKGYTNQIRNVGDNWQYKNKFGWWKLSKHPGKQARRNAQRLKNYLDAKGFNLGWVEPVVLWAGDEDKLTIENPETPIWKISELPTMEEFWKKQKLTREQVDQAVKILQEAIEQSEKGSKKSR